MQTNVDAILQAATDTTLFELVQDEIFDETSSYPAFVLTRRVSDDEPIDSDNCRFTLDWEYECHILRKKGDGWQALEDISREFRKNLIGTELRVKSQNRFEALISGDDVLVNTMMVVTQTRDFLDE